MLPKEKASRIPSLNRRVPINSAWRASLKRPSKCTKYSRYPTTVHRPRSSSAVRKSSPKVSGSTQEMPSTSLQRTAATTYLAPRIPIPTVVRPVHPSRFRAIPCGKNSSRVGSSKKAARPRKSPLLRIALAGTQGRSRSSRRVAEKPPRGTHTRTSTAITRSSSSVRLLPIPTTPRLRAHRRRRAKKTAV